MKNIKTIKIGIIGFVLIMISTLTFGQKIETEYRQNLEEAKKTNGTELFEDGTVKVQVNTKLIEQFYDAYDNNEYLSWKALINSSDTETFAEFWNTFRKANVSDKNLAEIKKELEIKYNEIAERSIKENNIHQNLLAEKQQKEKLLTQNIK